jgi:molybdopterin synthase catalytic subunit
MIKITSEAISMKDIVSSLRNKDVGAIVTFTGIVRGFSQNQKVKLLEVESYEEMALEDLKEIRKRALDRFGVEDAVIIHRVGTLEVSEDIVLIAVSSYHRT